MRLFGVEHPEPILFRSTFEEISAIGTMENKEDFQHFLEQLCSKELRWAIIKLRFFDQEEQRV